TPYRAFYDNPILYTDSDGRREKRAIKNAVEYLRGLPSVPAGNLSRNKAPNQCVCNEVVYWSYRRIAGDPYASMPRPRIEMVQWFSKSRDREFVRGKDQFGTNLTREDFNKIGAGDAIFMGNR